jgi:hypothetical protein
MKRCAVRRPWIKCAREATHRVDLTDVYTLTCRKHLLSVVEQLISRGIDNIDIREVRDGD